MRKFKSIIIIILLVVVTIGFFTYNKVNAQGSNDISISFSMETLTETLTNLWQSFLGQENELNVGAPSTLLTFHRSLIPIASTTDTVGTSTDPFAEVHTGDLFFNDEIKPDGVTCANGQILKKTGANNWDCAADGGGGGGAFAWTPTTDGVSTSTLLEMTAGAVITGSTTVDGILHVDGFTFSTTTTGCLEATATGLVWITGSACGTGAGGAFAWTPTTDGVSTSTLIEFGAGLISQASSTFSGATTTFHGIQLPDRGLIELGSPAVTLRSDDWIGTGLVIGGTGSSEKSLFFENAMSIYANTGDTGGGDYVPSLSMGANGRVTFDSTTGTGNNQVIQFRSDQGNRITKGGLIIHGANIPVPASGSWQLDNTLLGVYATSTDASSTLILASSTPSYAGHFLRFVDGDTASNLFTVDSTGLLTTNGGFISQASSTVTGTLEIVGQSDVRQLVIKGAEGQVNPIMAIQGSDGSDFVRFRNLVDSASNEHLAFFGANRTTPAQNDYYTMEYYLENDSGAQEPIVEERFEVNDVTAGSEDGEYLVRIKSNGAWVEAWRVSSGSSGAITLIYNRFNNNMGFQVRGTTDNFLIYTNPNNDTLTVGSNVSSAKFSVDGGADEVQTRIQANATQTNDIFVVEDSAGTDYFVIDGNGDVSLSGDLTVTGQITQDADFLSVYATTTRAIPNGSFGAVIFDVAPLQSGNMTFTAQTATATIPTTGTYEASVWIHTDKTGGANALVEVGLFVNNVHTAGCDSEQNITVDNITGHFGFDCVVSLTATDLVAIKARANTANAQLNRNGSSFTDPVTVGWELERVK